MYHLFFDESKEQPGSQNYQIAGFAIDNSQFPSLDNGIAEIQESYLGSSNLSKKNEIHAVDIVHNKKVYTDLGLEARVRMCKDIFKLVRSFDPKLFFVNIDTAEAS